MSVQYTLKPRAIGYILGGIAVYLALQSLITEFLVVEVLGDTVSNAPRQILDLFSVNLEASIPTWYATILLFCAALILGVIATAQFYQQTRFRWHWLGLALAFIYLSMDEGAVIHEISATPLQEAFNTSGFLEFGWQILAVPLVIIFGLFYLRFLFQLPRHIRNLFVIAAIFYVGGALVIEGISANQWANDDELSMTYLTIATLEEFCETIGVVIFIYALLRHITEQNYAVTITPTHAGETQRETSLGRRLSLALLVISAGTVATDLALTAWSQAIHDDDQAIFVAPGQIYQVFRDKFSTDEVVVSFITRPFDLQDVNSLRLAASFLGNYDDLIIISLESTESTLILAGDTLTISHDDLADLLHESGETQFIILDTVLIRALVSSL